MYIGHKREENIFQPLREHLYGVAEMAASFADGFDARDHAYRTGLLHDLGKYSPAGQRRMRDPERTPKVDHATAGAQEAKMMGDVPAAFAITGHHGGLVNIGNRLDADTAGTLQARLKKKLDRELDYSAHAEEINWKRDCLFPAWLDVHNAFSMQFYIRMLFSCIVDADYLDTEAFMNGTAPDRGDFDTIEQLHRKLMDYIQPWLAASDGALNGVRSEILRNSINAGDGKTGIYTMTVPTGGGKTVSSLAFALQHALRNGKKRVIYVIPYTSIIEQNAKVFAEILGQENVLEHHSNVVFDETQNPLHEKYRLATENWDAPIVVTTAVQFFESLYSARTSKARKLHNIAESVIIFDEAQMIPLSYLRPCVAAFTELVKHYGCTAVLCTATQPSLEPLIHEFCVDMRIREICPAALNQADIFRRVTYEWHGQMETGTLVQQMNGPEQVLCIVNTRKAARDVYQMLPEDGRFHLSTLMTASHRSRVLKRIRDRLAEGQTCRVVSTSLIEAGIDIDFPEVWREEAGLDSVLQAGGRCNREGRRSAQESIVHVFRLSESALKIIEQNVYAMRQAADHASYPAASDVISRYFSLLYDLRGPSLDLKAIMKSCQNFLFRDVSDQFRLIEDDAITVYIPTSENEADINALQEGVCNRQLLRRLGVSCVNIYRHPFAALRSAGKIGEFNEFYILVDPTAYSEECGLDVSGETGIGIMI